MAQYKVPQDVEADDKLLGPFSFRQFVYLLIAGGLIALAVGLFQIFPLLAIIPVPPILLFATLALPLKKDQPMETYLAAVISYYLKPHNRFWEPGQRESTITITAPKRVEENRTRDITEEEATHRLSFLANIVDTGGYAIKGAETNSIKEDLLAEANATADMFETGHFDTLENTIAKDENERHAEVMAEMRKAIEQSQNMNVSDRNEPVISKNFEVKADAATEVKQEKSIFDSPVVILPDLQVAKNESAQTDVEQTVSQKKFSTSPKPSIIELANNPDFSVATIAKEANRLNERDDEVFISLH